MNSKKTFSFDELKSLDITDAQHPFRQLAIRIIEDALEPVYGSGIQGEKYYELEDAIVSLLYRHFFEDHNEWVQ